LIQKSPSGSDGLFLFFGNAKKPERLGLREITAFAKATAGSTEKTSSFVNQCSILVPDLSGFGVQKRQPSPLPSTCQRYSGIVNFCLFTFAFCLFT
jgi:hypothetical protein